MKTVSKAYCVAALMVLGGFGGVAARADARQELQKTVPAFAAEQTPLQKVLTNLSAQAGVAVEVDWVRLYEVGVKRETPVTVKVEKGDVGGILRDVLSGVRAERAISFYADRDRVCISTLSDLRLRFQVVKTFDVSGVEGQRGLLAAVMGSVAPETWRDNGGAVGTARIVDGELVVNQSFDLMPAVEEVVGKYLEKNAQVTRVYDVRELVEATRDRDSRGKGEDLMETLVLACSPGSWREHGGKLNGISVFEGKLVVTGVAAVQGEIEATLGMLRKK